MPIREIRGTSDNQSRAVSKTFRRFTYFGIFQRYAAANICWLVKVENVADTTLLTVVVSRCRHKCGSMDTYTHLYFVTVTYS
jgi:hypothetical protein